MWKLESCDIYRDGGSLGAVLSDGTQKVSLFLEVIPWDTPSETLQYGSLWISEGEIPDKHGQMVLAGSETESEWLRQLENNVLTDIVDDCCKMRFFDLVSAIPSRNGGSI